MSTSTESERLIKELHGLFALIAKSPDNPARHYGEVAKVCAKLVDAETCSIWLLNRRTNELALCGEHGYNDRGTRGCAVGEQRKFVYGPADKGVTRHVYDTGEASRLRSAAELVDMPNHHGYLYKELWGGDDHKCHSWYQFPVKSSRALGVMKVENKLDESRNPVSEGGFSEEDEQILELIANSAVTIFDFSTELFQMVDPALARTSEIYNIFSRDLLDSLSEINGPRELVLNDEIMAFVGRVKREDGRPHIQYLKILSEHLPTIIKALKIKAELINYLQPLNDYQIILFHLPAYREHFVHQFNVFLIGYLILNNVNDVWFEHFRKVLDANTTNSDPTISHSSLDVFRTWFLASMMHDTGYPLGKAGDWTGALVSRMFGIEENQNRRVNVTESLANVLMRQGAADWMGFLTAKLCSIFSPGPRVAALRQSIRDAFYGELGEDVVAALVLIRAAEQLEIDESISAWAGTAIAAHEKAVWDRLNHIYFQTHPYAFLLFFCDSSQEHGRRRNAQPDDPWIVTKTEFQFDDKTVRVVLDYTHTPNKWDQVVAANDKARKVFLGPSNLKFVVDYRLDGKRDLGTLDFESVPST